MKKFKFTINGNEYAVDVLEMEDNICKLEVNGTPYTVEIEKKVKSSKTPTIVRPVAKETSKPEIDKKESGSAHPITAPLPGVVMEVKINPGDIIKKGQLLMVMEAMKMENKVLSDRNGVVESVRVGKGDSVLQGDVLLEIV